MQDEHIFAAAPVRRMMSREELYDLVWKTPMSRLAPTFGLSDVGLRKVCKRHGIPTPPLGYWAKVAHGKRANRPRLPTPKEGQSGDIYLVVHPQQSMSPSVAAEQDEAVASALEYPPIVVSVERPSKLHPLAAATGRALRARKPDDEGFLHTADSSSVRLSIGRGSVDRVLCIVDALGRAFDDRGYQRAEHEQGVRILVDAVPFAWQIHETKDRNPHQPTVEELKRQAQHDQNAERLPTLYNPDAKVYRSWDYFPSGRLAITFEDGTRYRWRREGLVGNWRDRKSHRLEDYLIAVLSALAAAAVAIKHRLAEEAERERQRTEALERRRREKERLERAARRHEYLLKKADEFARYKRLADLEQHLRRNPNGYSETSVDRLLDELRELVRRLEQGFKREALAGEIGRLQLYNNDDEIDHREP